MRRKIAGDTLQKLTQGKPVLERSLELIPKYKLATLEQARQLQDTAVTNYNNVPALPAPQAPQLPVLPALAPQAPINVNTDDTDNCILKVIRMEQPYAIDAVELLDI